MDSFFSARRALGLCVTSLALVVIASVAHADHHETVAPPPEPKTLVVESDEALPVQRITLDQALALAVKNNLGVEVARYEPQIAEQDVGAAWGAYDPVLQGSFGYELQEAPNTFSLNPQRVNQQRILDGNAGLQWLVPYLGPTLGFEWRTARTRSNSGIEALTPKYDSGIFFTANIPLLRGLIWNEPWTRVQLGKLGFSTSIEGFRAAVMDIAEGTINRYWTLVASQEQFEVATKSLETALALLDQTETQYEVGVVSKVEVVEAEAGVANREFNLIVARNDFENAEDELVDAVLGRKLTATMPFRLESADDPGNYSLREVDVERAVATALQRLPELRAADRAIEQGEVELKFARNQQLPQFDIDARYGFANVAGQANPRNVFGTPNGGILGDYDDSYNDMYSDDGFENFTVRGTLSIPIPNRTASRNVSKSRIELRRAKSRRDRTKQDAILAVRAAARGLLASAQGIDAAERRRLAAEEQLRAERIRLQHGESTPFEVLQRESDLVEAESQKIAALQSYRAAEARLERAQGTILHTYRISIDDGSNKSSLR